MTILIYMTFNIHIDMTFKMERKHFVFCYNYFSDILVTSLCLSTPMSITSTLSPTVQKFWMPRKMAFFHNWLFSFYIHAKPPHRETVPHVTKCAHSHCFTMSTQTLLLGPSDFTVSLGDHSLLNHSLSLHPMFSPLEGALPDFCPSQKNPTSLSSPSMWTSLEALRTYLKFSQEQ